MKKRLVSVIIPCRNEIRHIRKILDNLLHQELPRNVDLEMFIADGMSTDGTRTVLDEYSQQDARITIVDNVAEIVPTGLNNLIRRARGDVIIRMDVHADYAPDYIKQCVTVLDETRADNVGGPAQAMSDDAYTAKTIALAYHSPFGSGGARFHNPHYEGSVDTVIMGCWLKTTLERVGLFDEMLVRNQDDELNLRITRRGGTVWQSPRIRLWLQTRSSLTQLARQYMQYGYWKVYVIRKHKLPASPRHLAPGIFTGSLLLLALLSFFSEPARLLLAIEVVAYAVCSLAATLFVCTSPSKVKYIPMLPLVFGAYHLSYGFGFLLGLLDALWYGTPQPGYAAGMKPVSLPKRFSR